MPETARSETSDIAVLALLTGRSRAFGARHLPRGAVALSAIAKTPVFGPVAVGLLGLAGDEQADPIYHGGADKALHHYPFDHYRSWRGEVGDHPLLAEPGGFGENISTLGITEDTIWLGDRFRLGTALIEVSHGRQPCWKLASHFGRADFTARVVRTGRAGWYYRVLEPGQVAEGDRLVLVERGLPAWSVARLFAVLIAGQAGGDAAALRELTTLPVLADAWRHRARDLLERIP